MKPTSRQNDGALGPEDIEQFEQRLGGTPYEGWVYFHCGRRGQPGAASKAELWQILGPLRGQAVGAVGLNPLSNDTSANGLGNSHCIQREEKVVALGS